MTALISAESLRLRTLRSPRYVALGILALVALNAAPIMNGAPSTPGEVADWVRGLALLAVLMPAAYAANNIGDAFKRGSVAMTYLVHPQRDRVTAAHAIAYAGAGLVIAGTAVALALGIVLAVADADHVATGLSATDIALAVAGAAFAGAALGAAGTLVGTVTRHPAVGVGAVLAWNFAEALLTRGGTTGGISDYLPFQLVGSALSLTDAVPVLAAMGLLLAYLAVFALAVRRWALPRDPT